MLNLTRMELRRVFRDKSIYITLGVIIGILLIAMVTMKLVTNPELVDQAASSGFELTDGDVSDAAEFLQCTQVDFLGNLLFSGGLMTCLMAVVSSLIICDDFSTGFGKNIFSYYANRTDYLLSKLITNAAVSGFFLLSLTACTLLLFKTMGFGNALGNPVKLTAMLLVGWISVVSLCSQNLLFCMLTRSVTLSCIFSICCGLGLISGTLELLMGIFDLHIGQFLPSYNAITAPYIGGGPETFISSGFDSLLSPESVQTNPLLAVFAALVWMVIYILLSGKVLNKKDIC